MKAHSIPFIIALLISFVFTAGNTVMDTTLSQSTFDEAYGMSATNDGGVIFTGRIQPEDLRQRIYVVRLGNPLESSDLQEPLPSDISLSSFPNPFNPSTILSFYLPIASNVELNVFNIEGRLVESLLDKTMPAGNHEIQFNGTALPSGIYFVRMQAGTTVKTQKLVLLK